MALDNIQGVVSRGVRKVNEQVVQEGRALIITEENEDQYSWEDIPNGSLKVNGTTGLIMVKLAGQSNWIPSNIRLDIARDPEGNILDINGNRITDPKYLELVNTAISQGGHTISIARDAIVVRENFTIIDANVPGGQFSYEDEQGNRYFGTRNTEGFWFELKKGHYCPGRNMLDIIIDDCLYRSAASGGVVEISESQFIMPEELINGMELTVKYYQLNRIGNPYPRIYLRRGDYSVSGDFDTLTGNDDIYEPENAEVGDVWFDYNGDPDAYDGYLDDVVQSLNDGTIPKIPWDKITGWPKTVADAIARGIMVDVAVKKHMHDVSDITGLDTMILEACSGATSAVSAQTAQIAETAKTANNAQLLQNRTVGNQVDNIVAVQLDGKISPDIIPDSVKTIAKMKDFDDLIHSIHSIVQGYFTKGMIMAWYGNQNQVPSGWVICDGTNGTPDLRDRFVMGAGRFSKGDVIAPGLPNITGTFGGNAKAYPDPEGAFTRIKTGPQGSGNSTDGAVINFNASYSNDIYGHSNTVQPPAVVMYYIMKT